MSIRKLVGLALLLVLAGAPVWAQNINAAGATFPYPIYSKWFDEYHKLHPNVQINYQSIGSGGGIRQLMDKTVDFGASDGPMTDDQLKQAGFKILHFPTVLGAAVPSYNIPGVTAELKFTPEALAGIFLGKITKWNDPAISGANPGVKLPADDIIVIHRSDGSGTTYIWSDYLSKVSKDWKDVVGKGTKLTLPKGVGVAQQGSEGVTGFVSRSPGAVTYVELIYALKNADKVKFGPVKNKDGEYVLASMPSVTAAARNSLTEIPDDLRYSLTDASGKDSYPISGTNWAIVYVHPPAGKAELIVEFLRWVTHDGQERCESLHYARLPNELIGRIEKKLAEIK